VHDKRLCLPFDKDYARPLIAPTPVKPSIVAQHTRSRKPLEENIKIIELDDVATYRRGEGHRPDDDLAVR
jgi:hypothetical protein